MGERSRSSRRASEEDAETKLKSLRAALLERKLAAQHHAEQKSKTPAAPPERQAEDDMLLKFNTVARYGLPPGNWVANESEKGGSEKVAKESLQGPMRTR